MLMAATAKGAYPSLEEGIRRAVKIAVSYTHLFDSLSVIMLGGEMIRITNCKMCIRDRQKSGRRIRP